jgi:segregation and condensation protein B
LSERTTGKISGEALKAALEALVFVADDPIPIAEIVEVLSVPESTVRGAIEELRAEYRSASHGLRIEEVAGGMRFSTRPEVAPYLHRFSRLRHRRRLSAAALETLAIIAYREPITGPEIQEIRGVNPEGALKTLLERRLIRIVGRKKVVGRPLLYGSTRQFLVHFGLNRLEDLPPIEEFEKIIAQAGVEAGELGEPAVGSAPSDQPDGDDGNGRDRLEEQWSDGNVLGTGEEE